MCGIVGITHRTGVAERGLIERATSTLVHRGPDQQGTYESPAVSLGAVRLKIIDLDGGDQPVFSDDRNTVVVFNGEIELHGILLQDGANILPYIGRLPLDVESHDGRRSARRLQQRGEDSEERGFAGAVPSKHAEYFPVLNHQRKTPQSVDRLA